MPLLLSLMLATVSVLCPLAGYGIDRDQDPDWNRFCVGWSRDPEKLSNGGVNDGVMLADRFIVLAGVQGDAYQTVDVVNRTVEPIPPPPWSESALLPALARIDDRRVLFLAIDTESAKTACALYDVQSRNWSTANCPPWTTSGRDRRVRLTETGGSVFAFDGVNNPGILNLETMQWSLLSYPISGISFARHTQVAIEESRILVVASGTGEGRSVIYDLRTGRLERGPNIPEGRWAWSAVALPSGAMFLGGRDADHRPSRRAYIYRSVEDKWHPTTRMEHSRSDLSAVSLGHGRVLAVGGWDARLRRVSIDEIYDLNDNEWYPSGVPCTPRYDPLVFATPTDVFLVGGRVATGTRAASGLRLQASFETSVERWSPGVNAPAMSNEE